MDNSQSTISTREFTLTPGVYAREAVSDWSGRYWFVVMLPLIALAAYGVWFDWRYIVVTACLAFILFPTFAIVGFDMAMTSRSGRHALYPQSVTLRPDNSIYVKFAPLPPRDDSAGQLTPPEPLDIAAADITACRRWNRNTVVACRGDIKLIVPDRAFASPAESYSFEERLLKLLEPADAQ